MEKKSEKAEIKDEKKKKCKERKLSVCEEEVNFKGNNDENEKS